MDFRRFMNWRYDKWLEGIEHVTQKVHTRYPDAIIDWYNYGGCARQTPDMCWTMGHPLNPVNGSSYFFSRLASIESPTFAAKRFKAAAPSFGFWMCQRPILPECESLSSPYPAPYSQMVCGLTTVAHGGAAIAPFLKAGEHTAFGDAAKSIFTELKKLRPYVGDESVKYLALHFSQQTRDFGYYKEADNFWRQMRGSCEMLTRSQILTDIVFDQQLTYDNLSSYQMLMLSDTRCLADEQVEAVARFVSEGGTLLATYETSLYDELGQRRDNLALAEVLGVDYLSSPVPPEEDTGAVDPATGNIYVPQEKGLRDQFGYIVAWGYPFNRSPSRPPSVFGRRPPRPVCPWAFQARGMPSPFGRLGGQLPRPSAGNEILETHRLVGHGQFEHAIKHHAAAAGAAAIEAEHELVEVVAHVGTVGGPLMRSQQPPLGQ